MILSNEIFLLRDLVLGSQHTRSVDHTSGELPANLACFRVPPRIFFPCYLVSVSFFFLFFFWLRSQFHSFFGVVKSW